MTAVAEPEISFQAELYGEATHEETDRQTDGPSICTFVKPAGPRREEEPDGGDLAAVSAVRSSGSFRRQWVYEGSKRERSGRFSSMRALSLTQSHSSLPFWKGRHLIASDVTRGRKVQDLNFHSCKFRHLKVLQLS